MGKPELSIIRKNQLSDNEHFAYVRQYLKTIPEDVSVRTHEFFAPHLANRKELHIYENRNPKEGASQKAMEAECVIVDRNFLGDDWQNAISILQSNYALVHEHEGFYVFQRKSNIE